MVIGLRSTLGTVRRGMSTLLLLAIPLTVGCADRVSVGDDSTAEGPTELAVWSVGEEPRLEIGVVEGDEPYQLYRVSSSARLPDEGVVVANTGSGELRFFDATGRFVRAVGRRGDGPGEWRGPDRVRLTGPDSLLVLDTQLGRRDIVTVDGSYLGGTPMRPDVIFPWDHWIHRRFIVDSPLAPEERGVVARALDRIIVEGADAPAQLARVTPSGEIWIAGGSSSDKPVEWIIHDLEGRPVARLSTPARFDVHDQGEDWILGVKRDSLDVERVVSYRLDRAGSAYREDALARAVQAWTGASTATFARVSPGSHPDLNAGMKRLATLQEIYYSQHFKYSASLDSLTSQGGMNLRLSEGVTFEPLRAGPDGWAGRSRRDGMHDQFRSVPTLGRPGGHRALLGRAQRGGRAGRSLGDRAGEAAPRGSAPRRLPRSSWIYGGSPVRPPWSVSATGAYYRSPV
jgi:hypothetical protein